MGQQKSGGDDPRVLVLPIAYFSPATPLNRPKPGFLGKPVQAVSVGRTNMTPLRTVCLIISLQTSFDTVLRGLGSHSCNSFHGCLGNKLASPDYPKSGCQLVLLIFVAVRKRFRSVFVCSFLSFASM